MIKIFHHHLPLGTVVACLLDGLLCFVAVILASLTILITSSIRTVTVSEILLPAALIALLMSALYASLGIYHGERGGSRESQFRRALVAIVIGCLPVYALFDVFIDGGYARTVLGYVLVYLIGGLVVVRHTPVWSLATRFGSRRVLIIGLGTEATAVAADLRKRGARQFEIVGFYPTSTDDTHKPHGDERIFSRRNALIRLVREQRVDEIVVAVKEQRGGVLPIRELLECRTSGIPVRGLAEFYERCKGEVRLDSLKASWLIYGRGFVQHSTRSFVKRTFDILISLILLTLAWPIMLATAIAIRLEGPGPILFMQERVGLRGRVFKVLKFRSMRIDAEKDGIARWASQNDSRVTRVGAFIRMLRIDELPQLLNVLWGEMSLVGPRPERPSFVSELAEKIPFYDIRHCVKPGVTGWAQVRFSYGASVEDSRHKLQFDLYYVKNHTLFLDLLVIVETVRVVLFREGAH